MNMIGFKKSIFETQKSGAFKNCIYKLSHYLSQFLLYIHNMHEYVKDFSAWA